MYSLGLERVARVTMSTACPAKANPEPRYREWKGAAVAALQKLDERAAKGHP